MTTLSIQVKGAELVRKGLQDLSADVPKVGAQAIYEAMMDARARMAKEGKRISYPVSWDSERQRRAYFATDGFGHGIPYRRTGAYEKAWHVRRNPSGDRVKPGYSLINDMSYAQYVGGDAYGTSQSNIHRARWAVLREVVEKMMSELPKRVQRYIDMVSRRDL